MYTNHNHILDYEARMFLIAQLAMIAARETKLTLAN